MQMATGVHLLVQRLGLGPEVGRQGGQVQAYRLKRLLLLQGPSDRYGDTCKDRHRDYQLHFWRSIADHRSVRTALSAGLCG